MYSRRDIFRSVCFIVIFCDNIHSILSLSYSIVTVMDSNDHNNNEKDSDDDIVMMMMAAETGKERRG